MANLGNLVIAITATTKGLESAAKKTTSILGGISKTATSLPAILTGAGVGATLTGIGRVADQYAVMASQLEFVTGSAAAAEAVQDRLYEISKRTGTQMEDNAGSFVKLTQASKLTGLSMDQNLDVVETLNSLMIKTGTSGAQASAAMLQLSQALTSGKLAGDEFRSVSENAPGLLNALSEAAGIAREDLKQMASDGELTSELLAQAFLKIRDQGVATFEDLPSTASRGLNAIALAWGQLWDYVNDETGIIGKFEAAMFELAGYIEDNSAAVAAWVEDAWAKLVKNAPDILNTIQSIGGAVVWVAETIAAAIDLINGFIAAFKAEQELAAAWKDNANQNQFIEDIVAQEGLGDAWQQEFGESAPKGNTVINNNFNQQITRDDVNNIAKEQSTQDSRY